jgi:hypothetical protein
MKSAIASAGSARVSSWVTGMTVSDILSTLATRLRWMALTMR